MKPIISIFSDEQIVRKAEQIVQKAKDKRLIAIMADKKTYTVHPLIAYFLFQRKAGHKMEPVPVELRRYLPISDCMQPSKGDPISVFTLCENSTDSEKMLQALLCAVDYTVSPTTLEFIKHNPQLRIGAGLTLCKPFYKIPEEIETTLELEIGIARGFLTIERPSASVLGIMSRVNTISLSLCAHTLGLKIKANTGYVLIKEQILDELRKTPDLIEQLSPALKILALLLIEQSGDEQLEVVISIEEAKALFEQLYPAGRVCTLPEKARQLIAKKIISMYHNDFLNLILKSPRDSFWIDFHLFTPYLNEIISFETIVAHLIDYKYVPKKILDSVDATLFQEHLNARLETAEEIEHNYSLFNSLLNLLTSLLNHVKQQLLSPEFFDGIHLNNTANIKSLFSHYVPLSLSQNAPILYNHLMTLPEFLPYLVECVSQDIAIQLRVNSTLGENQYHRLLELLDSDQYKEASQTLKLSLLCFYEALFQPQHLNDLTSRLGQLNIKSLDHVFLKIEQDYMKHYLHLPLVHRQGVSRLFEANPRACSEYYLSGLRDEQHLNRVKWLHVYGFKIDLSLIEHLLKKEHFVGDQLLTVKRVLALLKEPLKYFTSIRGQFIITPLDRPLEKALINLFKTYQSQIIPYLPELNELQPYELCVIRIFYRLGIARENQSVSQFCAQIRDANPLYNGFNDTHILKAKLSTLLETSSHERVMLYLLVKAEQAVFDILLQIYTWAYHQSEYQIPSINQIYDLLVHSLNQTNMERDAVAFSLTQSKQLKELTERTTDLQAQVTVLTQLIQQQTLMFTKLLHQVPNPEDVPNRRPGFFTS